MSFMTLKSDIISNAYSKLRISGLKVEPTPEDNVLALNRLEMIAYESGYQKIGYNFEKDPDTASKHNIDIKYVDSVSSILAVRLMPDFGKGFTPDQVLSREYGKAVSQMAGAVALCREAIPMSGFPIGSGNRRRYTTFDSFWPDVDQAPLSTDTISLRIGDIEDYTESFESWLKDSEDISSYTIEAETGLTIVSDSIATHIVSYRVQAGSSIDLGGYKVTIIATSDTGRKTTRYIYFEVIE